MTRSDYDPVNRALLLLEAGKKREAFSALKRLAEAGNDAAFPMLGYMYDVGEGTRRNAARAMHWYLLGYKAGSTMCASNIATVYRDAGDARNEYKWYLRAAELGDGDAMVEVAIRLLAGKGVRRNLKAAISNLRKVPTMREVSDAARDTAKQLLWGCENTRDSPQRHR